MPSTVGLIGWLLVLTTIGLAAAGPAIAPVDTGAPAAPPAERPGTAAKDTGGEIPIIINLDLALLQIHPAETMTLLAPKVQVLLGHSATIQTGAKTTDERTESREYQLTIRPARILPDGIELQFQWTMKIGTTTNSGKAAATVRNLEKAVVNLFEDRGRNIKYAIQVVPLVENAQPAGAYPMPLHELRITGGMLLLNDRRVWGGSGSDGSARSDQEGAVHFEILTKQFGRFRLFFRPAGKTDLMGTVKGNLIRFDYRDNRFELISRDDFLDGGPWKVWIQHDPDVFTYPARGSGSKGPAGPDWSVVEASVGVGAGVKPQE